MKKLRAKMDRYFAGLDERWKALPRDKQLKYTLLFFLVYAALTTVVVFHAWYNAGKSGKAIAVEHIENPVLKKSESPARLQDTISIILKNQIYERK